MKILRWSLLMALSLVLTVSCTDDTAEIKPLSSELIKVPESILMDQELEQTANLLANFIDENQVTAELFTYATVENDGEVYATFKSLFSDKIADNGKVSGSFASKFRSSDTSINGRKRSKIQLEDLERKLGEGYALYAPYLLEKFSSTNQPITVSWYNGQNTSGVTPGILSTQSCLTSKDVCVQVTDEYASKNPTIVIVPVENSNKIEQAEAHTGNYAEEGGSGSVSNLSCTVQNVELQMPKYKLRDHVRAWPRRNLLYLWVLSDPYFFNPDGSIQTHLESPFWRRKKVSRNNVGKWLNSDLPFIVQGWPSEIEDVQIIFGYHKFSRGNKLEYTGVRGAAISQKNAVMLTSPIFDRCATLSRQANAGNFGTKDGYRVYRFDKIEFYLKGETF